MFVRLRTHLYRSEGASAVEYAVLIAAIAAVITLIVFTLGRRVKSSFSKANTCISAHNASCATGDDDEGDNEGPGPGPTNTRRR